jgi:hypothetical protein
VTIFSNDAPGFNRDVLQSEGYKAIRDKIRSFIPQSSIIGMLFEHGEKYTVVKSNESGFLQHCLYTWEVLADHLVTLDTVSREGKFISKTLDDWIGRMEKTQRRQFVEALYTILSATRAQTVSELSADALKSAIAMAQFFGNLDKDTRAVIFKTLAELVKAGKNNLPLLRAPQIPGD